MPNKPCSSDGCARPAWCRGYCHTHYSRWRLTRTDGPRCTVDGCAGAAIARGWCSTHYQRWQDNGDPVALQGDTYTVTYVAAHKRVHRARGPAREHTCTCGEPATAWAYDHQDPNVKTETVPGWGGHTVRFSTDPDHYVPLCGSCHTTLDLEQAAKRLPPRTCPCGQTFTPSMATARYCTKPCRDRMKRSRRAAREALVPEDY